MWAVSEYFLANLEMLYTINTVIGEYGFEWNLLSTSANPMVLISFEYSFNPCHWYLLPLLKLINNSSSWDKGNHNREGGLDTRYLLLSFCFHWEDISNTRDSISVAIQTPRISSKILRSASYFQLSSLCLDIPMKHCLSCLMYYFPMSSSHTIKPWLLVFSMT